MKSMEQIAKAIVATATYVGGWIATVTQPAADGFGSEITGAELGIGIAGAIAMFFGVWAVPNGIAAARNRTTRKD